MKMLGRVALGVLKIIVGIFSKRNVANKHPTVNYCYKLLSC